MIWPFNRLRFMLSMKCVHNNCDIIDWNKADITHISGVQSVTQHIVDCNDCGGHFFRFKYDDEPWFYYKTDKKEL